MRVGFYECDITPPLGGNMPGYYREHPAKNVFERLYAKACVMEEDGKYAAIVALDTCEYVDEMTKIVTDRVFEYTGIPAESICIHIVHTHKGAPVEDCPWVGQRPDFEYRSVFYRLAADAIILAYLRLTPAEAKFAQGTLEGVAYNRNYVRRDGKCQTFHPGEANYAGTMAGIDPALPVLVFESEGKKLGALISYACHQDCTDGEVNGYSSDYSGVMGKELKRVYGEDFVSVFMIGTAGDINHCPNDASVKLPPFWYREIGKMAAKAAEQAIEAASPVGGKGIDVVKEELKVPRRNGRDAKESERLKTFLEKGSLMRARNLFYYRATNRVDHSMMPLQVIRVGDVGIYVMPGEIYVNFGLEIKRRSKFAHNFVVENSNLFGGYIPTPEAFAENADLYETSLCPGSRHIPEAGGMMVEKLLEMAGGMCDSDT